MSDTIAMDARPARFLTARRVTLGASVLLLLGAGIGAGSALAEAAAPVAAPVSGAAARMSGPQFRTVANTSPLPGQGCAHASTQGLAHGLGKRCETAADAYTVTQVVHVGAGSPAYLTFPAHAAGDTPDPASLTITSTPDDPNAPADIAVLNDSVGVDGDNAVYVKIRNNGGAATVTLTVSFVSASAPAA